jgi:acetyl-CoA C-acetyltransferase
MDEAWIATSNKISMERKNLEACYISTCFLPITNKLGLAEGFLSEVTGLHVPMQATRSVSAALASACQAIQAGVYSTVLVGGLEKMTDRWDKIRDDLMLLDDPWSYYAGGTPETNHELMLRAYIHKYGIAGEDLEKLNKALAMVSVKNHANATKNPYAQFQRKISVETVLKSRAEEHKQLGLFDFAPISDGATALIVTSEEKAKKIVDNPVYVKAYSSATDYLNYPARNDLTHFAAAKIASKKAMQNAQFAPTDIQMYQVYDQSTMMEMVSLEDLGLCEAGTAWKYIYESGCKNQQFYEINGKPYYFNLNGGLKADGNPFGASGGVAFHELFKQLQQDAGERQVILDDGVPKLGCALEFEGFGTKAYVTVLGRD